MLSHPLKISSILCLGELSMTTAFISAHILLAIFCSGEAFLQKNARSVVTQSFGPGEALDLSCTSNTPTAFRIPEHDRSAGAYQDSEIPIITRQGERFTSLSFVLPGLTVIRWRSHDGRRCRRSTTTSSACSSLIRLVRSAPMTNDNPSTIINMRDVREGHHDSRSQGKTRADFVQTTVAAIGISSAFVLGPRRSRAVDLGGVEFGQSESNKFDIPPEDNPDGLRSPRPLAYRVEYTDPPTTIPFPKSMEDRLVKEMADHKLLFFGVHGDSPTDQGLAARLMEKIAAKLKDKTAIGFEQVERQFQSALDEYIADGRPPGASEPGDVLDQADARLAEATEWGKRSILPFDAYRPVFHMARRRGLPLVALGMDSERVFQVMQDGMDSLGEDDRNNFVSDLKGFVSYVRDKGFQAYADRLIFPSYERLKEEGLLGDKPPSKPNFFSARILADEALASRAVEWVTNNGNRPLMVLQREDRVKFGFGASGRAARIAKSFGGELPTKTILVNPTALDSLSDNRSLRLALEYADDLYAGKPLADYLWFSKSPKVNLIPRMLNPETTGWLEQINLYELRGSAKT